MEAKSIKINKNSVDITLSVSINEYVSHKEAINKLLELAIDNGISSNIVKQVFDVNGKIKVVDKHTFF